MHQTFGINDTIFEALFDRFSVYLCHRCCRLKVKRFTSFPLMDTSSEEIFFLSHDGYCFYLFMIVFRLGWQVLLWNGTQSLVFAGNN